MSISDPMQNVFVENINHRNTISGPVLNDKNILKNLKPKMKEDDEEIEFEVE